MAQTSIIITIIVDAITTHAHDVLSISRYKLINMWRLLLDVE